MVRDSEDHIIVFVLTQNIIGLSIGVLLITAFTILLASLHDLLISFSIVSLLLVGDLLQ
jgi:large-conductance mechanosensitive channel